MPCSMAWDSGLGQFASMWLQHASVYYSMWLQHASVYYSMWLQHASCITACGFSMPPCITACGFSMPLCITACGFSMRGMLRNMHGSNVAAPTVKQILCTNLYVTIRTATHLPNMVCWPCSRIHLQHPHASLPILPACVVVVVDANPFPYPARVRPCIVPPNPLGVPWRPYPGAS
jgi:hypothetical protein